MKRAVIILIIIAAVAGAGFWANNKLRAASPAGAVQYKVMKAEIGNVRKTVSATGVLQPWTTVTIKSKAGGRVDRLLVDVGSKVKPGQVLAQIDPTDTKLNVDQAQADINSADARIASSQLTADLQRKQSALAVATAETSVASAKANLDASRARLATTKQQRDAQPKLTNANIASAQENVNSAQQQLKEMLEATNPQEQALAQSSYDQAVANTTNAEANLTRQKKLLEKGYVSQQVVDQAQASYDVAKAQTSSAKLKLDTMKQQQDAAVASQRARVAQARAQLNNAQAGSVDIEVRKSAVTEAEAAVRQNQKAVENAVKNLELARANLANVDIRRTDIASAQATRMRAMASMKNAEATFQQTVVRAPSDGVVLKKFVEQGTIISSALSFAATGNDILQIGDVTRQYVDVTVDETDIANVDEGQKVDVSIEAYPGVLYEGKVTRVDPQAVVESNVTNIHVRVEIDNSDVKFQLLKPGMNATCEFVSKEKDEVVTVPSEAVRSDDQGRYVEVAVGGKPAPPDPKTGAPADANMFVDVKPERRAVEVGIEGNDTVEIASGLKEGEKIVTTTIEPVVQQAGGAIGGGGFGGGRGGGRR